MDITCHFCHIFYIDCGNQDKDHVIIYEHLNFSSISCTNGWSPVMHELNAPLPLVVSASNENVLVCWYAWGFWICLLGVHPTKYIQCTPDVWDTAIWHMSFTTTSGQAINICNLLHEYIHKLILSQRKCITKFTTQPTGRLCCKVLYVEGISRGDVIAGVPLLGSAAYKPQAQRQDFGS